MVGDGWEEPNINFFPGNKGKIDILDILKYGLAFAFGYLMIRCLDLFS